MPVHDTLDGHVDDLLAVIDGRPAVVVGHSYGGDIALGAALRPGGSGADPGRRRLRAPDAVARHLGHPAQPGAGRPASGDDDPGMVAERFFRRMVGDSAWDRLPEATKEARRADGPRWPPSWPPSGSPNRRST